MTDTVRTTFEAHLPDGRALLDDSNFFELGLTSRTLVSVLDELRAAGLDVRLLDLYRFSSLRQLGAALAERAGDCGGNAGRGRLPWQD
ncbi:MULTISPECIES: acyl carrier protein [Actinosynnema]|uniref:phosphopantetheine-binding protein n=1 Tax=Actinosynnema TaxID=40566 RepID=UPI0020A4C925|nr:acyl carrier protein [Actinosynnema pretiosum]